LAFTSAHATRFIAVRVLDAGDAAEAPSLFARAVSAADADLRADEGGALCAADAEKLLATLARRAPGVLDRLYLQDASGDPVVLDRGELRVGARRIDLSAPLEWRAFVFEERGVHAVSVCQATWVRQGTVKWCWWRPSGKAARRSRVRRTRVSCRRSPANRRRGNCERPSIASFMLPLRTGPRQGASGVARAVLALPGARGTALKAC